MAHDPLDATVTEALRAWQVQHEAGVAPATALATCAQTWDGGHAGGCFARAAAAAANGAPAGELLAALAPVVPPTERAVLAAGFKGGRLDAALRSVVARRELLYATRSRVRARLTMPALILLMAAVIAPLPAFVLGGSGLTYALHVAVPLALAAGLFLLVQKVLRTRAWGTGGEGGNLPPGVAATLDRLLLALPLAGRVERHRNLYEFAGLLSNLIGAGMLLSEALAVCARALPNGRYRAEGLRLSRETQAGQPLCAVLQAGGLWPREFVMALESGERAGRLEETCAHLAQQWNERYARAMEQVGEWLPRVLYALVCLFIIYNIFQMVLGLAAVYDQALRGL